MNKEKARHNTSVPRSRGLCWGRRGPDDQGTLATESKHRDVGDIQLSLSADVNFFRAELLYLTAIIIICHLSVMRWRPSGKSRPHQEIIAVYPNALLLLLLLLLCTVLISTENTGTLLAESCPDRRGMQITVIRITEGPLW